MAHQALEPPRPRLEQLRAHQVVAFSAHPIPKLPAPSAAVSVRTTPTTRPLQLSDLPQAEVSLGKTSPQPLAAPKTPDQVFLEVAVPVALAARRMPRAGLDQPTQAALAVVPLLHLLKTMEQVKCSLRLTVRRRARQLKSSTASPCNSHTNSFPLRSCA